jgi:hypothetical protein
VIPLYGFLEGDTIGLLVLAQPNDTIAELADKLRASAAVRVRREGAVVVQQGDRVLDPRATVDQMGLTPLDRFDVRFVERP